jgi:3-oxoacyl-[acyl-carrier protein] reductase
MENVIIVGGSKGAGWHAAKTLAKAGYQVNIIARDPPADSTDTTKDTNISKDTDHNIRYWRANILEENSIKKVLKSINETTSGFNHIIFYQRYRKYSGEGSNRIDETLDDWDGEIMASLTATKNIIEESTKYFGTGNKSIIIIGSIASKFISDEQQVSYHACKAAMSHIMKYYALKLGSLGIRVNSILPGIILKDENKKFYDEHQELALLYKKIIPIGRMITSEDITGTVEFLVSNRSSGITGQEIIVDGGITLRSQDNLARMLTGQK